MREAEVPSLVTLPTIFGERHCPDQKGSVTNINQVTRNNHGDCFQYQDGLWNDFTIYQVHHRISSVWESKTKQTQKMKIFSALPD